MCFVWRVSTHKTDTPVLKAHEHLHRLYATVTRITKKLPLVKEAKRGLYGVFGSKRKLTECKKEAPRAITGVNKTVVIQIAAER